MLSETDNFFSDFFFIKLSPFQLLWLEPIADVPYLSAEVCRKYDELAVPSTSQPMVIT